MVELKLRRRQDDGSQFALLWVPIDQLEDKHDENLLVWAPELVDPDFNACGAGMGHFQDGPWHEDLSSETASHPEGTWLANLWDGTNDEWRLVPCTPTHFIKMKGPN